MNHQQNFKQPNMHTIEMLKLARNQVVKHSDTGDDNEYNNTISEIENLPTDNNVVHSSPSVTKDNLPISAPSTQVRHKGQGKYNEFTKAFVQKLSFIKQEKQRLDQEIAKIEKKKQDLEKRREEVIEIRNKLIALNKQMDSVLNNNK